MRRFQRRSSSSLICTSPTSGDGEQASSNRQRPLDYAHYLGVGGVCRPDCNDASFKCHGVTLSAHRFLKTGVVDQCRKVGRSLNDERSEFRGCFFEANACLSHYVNEQVFYFSLYVNHRISSCKASENLAMRMSSEVETPSLISFLSTRTRTPRTASILSGDHCRPRSSR